MARYIVGIVLIAHGIAHGVGVAGSLLGLELEGGTAPPTIDVGAAEPVFASLFLVGLIAFVVAGAALIARRGWWRPVAALAAVVSMAPVLVWWEAAHVGAYLNAFAVGAVVAARWVPGLTGSPEVPASRDTAPPRPEPTSTDAAARRLEGSTR